MVGAELVAFVSPIVSALFIWYIQHRHVERDRKRDAAIAEEKRKQEEKEKEREQEQKCRAEARKQENLLTMRMMKAVGKLSYANSVAIKEGKVNGVMEEALVYYRDASDEMTEFLQEQAVEYYNK